MQKTRYVIVIFLTVSCVVIIYRLLQLDDRHPRKEHIHAQYDKHTCTGAHGLTRTNGGIAAYSSVFYARLRALTSRNATSRDLELISLVRNVIDPPSEQSTTKLTRALSITPQAQEIEALLHKKRGGFFVECGALDGERSSNSLHLEKKRDWTGLLIEMDPHFYTQLLGKARQAWSINACLSPYNYVIELPFFGHFGGGGKIGLIQNSREQTVPTIPCFPLETLLLALNRTHVDYFSLDVEGMELNVLRMIPFDRITIDTLSVEYLHVPEGKEAMHAFMKQAGFDLHKDIHKHEPAMSFYADDFIFVRKTKI